MTASTTTRGGGHHRTLSGGHPAGNAVLLVKLFHEQDERLKRYGGVRKIFYGGEPFPPAERARLQRNSDREYPLRAYGSNDAGPMGYQCPHCEGGAITC